MSRVHIRPQARTEILDGSDWYERQSPGLGTEFVRAIDKALLAIADHPSAFSPIGKGARRFALRRFPYSIIYRQEGDTVVVYSCFHSHRDPKRWQRRL